MDIEEFDIRVGRVVRAEDFPAARKPSYKLEIDFGALGVKRSVAQLCANYSKEQLAGKLVLCVVSLPPKRIGPVVSEVLTLGVPDANGECILVAPDSDAPLGGKLY